MSTDIYIYGMIGKPWWADDDYNGVNEIDVVNALNALERADKHTIHFNSAGGVIKVGIGIMNVIRAHEQRQQLTNSKFVLRTVNDGICYSAASYGFLAGKERCMNLGSNFLVHNASTYAEGNATALRNTATELDGIDANLAALYANMLGKDADHWLNLMALDEIVNADQTVNLGLATECDKCEATNMFPDFSPENVKKEGFDKLMRRALNQTQPKKIDLLTPPTAASAAPAVRSNAANNRLNEARIKSNLARLDK